MATTTFADGEAAERIDYAAILPKRTKAVILVGVLLSLFLAALDQTIVATALPAIINDLNGLDLLSWVSAGYLLASTTMVPIYGKLSDLYGRRAVLLWGISIFLIGSVLCGIANDMLQLILYRVIQGIGAAALTSTAFAIPADLFAPIERPRYMGMFGGVFGLASVIGPYVGGLLTDTLSWHWIFYVNLPIGIIALVFIVFKMPRLASGLRGSIDWPGTILLVVGVVPLLLGLTLDKTTYPWTSPLILGLFAVAAVATALFLVMEMRAPSPIISPKLFRNRTFSVIVLASTLNGAAFFAVILFLSIFMVNVVQVSTTAAGTTLIPLTLSLVVGGIISSAIVQRIGRYKVIILTGFVIMLIGFYLLSGMHVATTRWEVTWRMIVLGLGLGPSMPLLNLALQNAVPFDVIGAATASRQFFQQLGQAFGAAIFGAILATTLPVQLNANMQPIVAQLPPALQSRFDLAQLQQGSSSAEGGAGGQVNVSERISSEINARFSEQRALLTAAILHNDPQAVAALQGSAATPAQLKALLGSAGSDLPLPARERILREVLTQLDAAESEALGQGQALGAEITQAIRVSFATSITRIYWYAIWLIVAAFLLIALALPELPLRKSNRDLPLPIAE